MQRKKLKNTFKILYYNFIVRIWCLLLGNVFKQGYLRNNDIFLSLAKLSTKMIIIIIPYKTWKMGHKLDTFPTGQYQSKIVAGKGKMMLGIQWLAFFSSLKYSSKCIYQSTNKGASLLVFYYKILDYGVANMWLCIWQCWNW